MKITILDIETKADKSLLPVFTSGISAPKTWKDEAKIKEYLAKKEKEANRLMATDTDYADIICIGIKELGQDPRLFNLPEFITWYNEAIKDDAVRWVTFNGKKFDFPVIIKNGVKAGYEMPYRELKEASKRWHSPNHWDLMEIIGDSEWKSLDTYAKIYLGTEKKEIDFETATEEVIKEHCLEDLGLTEELFKKFRYLCYA